VSDISGMDLGKRVLENFSAACAVTAVKVFKKNVG
jgi:hypothetical protein